MKSIFFALIAFAFLVSSCAEVPDPPAGFSEPFYVSFDFLGEKVLFERDELDVLYRFTPGETATHGFINVFEDERFEVSLTMTFVDALRSVNIRDTKGATLTSVPGALPGFSLFIVDKLTQENYTTELETFDYGPSAFEIETVDKGEVISYVSVSSNSRKGRSFVVRGTMSLNVSESVSIPGTLNNRFPIENGQFSIKVFVP
ncbi:MAG: hypothetical protein AB8F95_09875 [Bacteroidia bacterium]